MKFEFNIKQIKFIFSPIVEAVEGEQRIVAAG